jgi:hypothetical protein
MSEYRLWPIAILLGVVGLYFWVDDDSSGPDHPAQQEQPVTQSPVWLPNTPSQGTIGNYQPPVDPYGGYSMENPAPEPVNQQRILPPTSAGYRFRADQQTVWNGQQAPKYPNEQMGTPTPYPNYQGYSSSQQPNSNYRFRPLRQNKRWTGNFPSPAPNPALPSSPYDYQQRMVPTYSPRPADLWANSWTNPSPP